MRINVKGTAEGAVVDIVQPGDGGPDTDQVLQSIAVTEGNELLLNVPIATAPTQIEYGNVVSASGDPAPPPPLSEGGDVGGGNEGSSQGGATETGEGDQTPPPVTDPESPGPNAGDQGDGKPTTGEGEGGGAPAAGDQGGSETPTPPTTSAASEKPLYLVDGDVVLEGFSESGLETPDGKTLFHFGTDVAGGPTTGNADGVSVYAESADNEQPVVAAAPAEGAGA